jgi:Fe-S cluster assembly iron-binding protein IscA
MFTLTEAAGARLADKISKKSVDVDIALRFVRQGERRGWTLQIDKPCPSDVTFLHEGRIVLVLDEPSSQLLRNRMLDIRETDEGPRLQLRGS